MTVNAPFWSIWAIRTSRAENPFASTAVFIIGARSTAFCSRSRSSAERFATIVGKPPLKYVTEMRMHQARQWLMHDRARIAVVAARLGYDSEAAFSRAFKRVIGAPPSHFRGEETGGAG
ncbi:MAG: helix-turn-helix transcriptional regulator [Mesorhizobium sp.]|nr:helix-turn-helix transcriptional regulator [Mesorhizobium sp.]